MATISTLATRIANGWKRFQPIWSFSTRMTPQQLQKQYDEAADERKLERQRAHQARLELHKARNAAWHQTRGTDAAQLREERLATGDQKRIPDLPADHYLQQVDVVKELKRKGDLIAAESLLKEMLAAMEKECEMDKRMVSPWYYEQLAVVYRRKADLASELSVLERYFQAPHPQGDKTRKLHERLERVRAQVAISKSGPSTNVIAIWLFFYAVPGLI